MEYDEPSFDIKYRKNKHLNFKGDGLFGVEYAKEISGSLIGLGLLSKWIPELHTTRTFEIPACGTALLTEKNSDTSQFFNDEECLFYNESNDIVAIVKEKLADKEYLQTVSIKGHQKIINSRKNYFHILEDILLQINLK